MQRHLTLSTIAITITTQHRLKLYGVSGHLYEWFEDYCLNGRCHRVVVGVLGACVASGVPQGSILGPVLFVIFNKYLLNLLPDKTSGALYADDTKVYKSINSEAHCEILQHALASHARSWNIDNNRDPSADHYTEKDSSCVRLQNEFKGSLACGKRKRHWCSRLSYPHAIIGKENRMSGMLKRACPLLTNNSLRRTL